MRRLVNVAQPRFPAGVTYCGRATVPERSGRCSFVFIAKNAPRRLPVRPALPIMRASFGQLAQLVEQRIENPRVRGSIPRLATRIRTPTTLGWGFLLFVPTGENVTATPLSLSG